MNVLILAALTRELVPIQNHLVSVYKNKPGVNLNFKKIPVGLRSHKVDMKNYMIEKSVDIIINAGTAGSVSTHLQLLDIFFPTHILDVKNHVVSLELSKSVLRLTPGHWKAGTLFTSKKPVLSSKRKNEIARDYRADAVDMEAYPIARACAAVSIPFVSLKVISDTSDSSTMTIFMRNLEKAVKKLSIQLEVFIEILLKKEGTLF